jgi:hypothetical protein
MSRLMKVSDRIIVFFNSKIFYCKFYFFRDLRFYQIIKIMMQGFRYLNRVEKQGLDVSLEYGDLENGEIKIGIKAFNIIIPPNPQPQLSMPQRDSR